MQPWQKQADGSLLRRIGGLRVVVCCKPMNGAFRFILIQETRSCPGPVTAMIASGHEQSVQCAMAAAEKMAGRLMDSRRSLASERPMDLEFP
jgi:hypothetical protein